MSDKQSPEPDGVESDGEDQEINLEDDYFDMTNFLLDDTDPEDEAPVPRPINWDLLSPSDAEHEWLVLNEWVHWLRRTYGLPAAVVPPFWHRHPELVWELSALHLHWLGAYDIEQDGSAPIGWHRDFADARERLREWVSTSGTRLDRDRPTRLTNWPGEEPAQESHETVPADRETDFYEFVTADIERRRLLLEELSRLRTAKPSSESGDPSTP